MSKSPSLRRIQADIRELALDPSDRYHAAPLEDDMFEWHFTIRGADGTDFEGGVYHGRILLPPEYPFKPPNIVFLTPSGRFETGTKVCLSFSAYHPELWQPAWGIRLILEALISFLPTPADGAIGALDWSSAERKKLATKSVDYCCPRCGKAVALLPKLSTAESRASASRFQKEIERLHQLQWEHEGKKKAEAAAPAEEKEAGAVNSDANAETKKEESEGDDNNKIDGTTISTTDVTAADKGHPAEEEDSKIPVLKTEHETREEAQLEGNSEKPRYQTQDPATTVQERTNNVPVPQEDESNAALVENVIPEATAAVDDLTSRMIDPLLQAMVVLLAVICYMLIRKGFALYEEIRRLDSD